MGSIIGIFVVIAMVTIFPAFLFYLFIRAIRIPGTRWWGIVILLALLTAYLTCVVGIAGLIVGGNATGSAAMEQMYCKEFVATLAKTDTVRQAVADMDAAVSSGEEYLVKEPEKNLRFRYVWLLGGCFLFAGANLLMFGPGRRERRNPADCIVAVIAALVVFLTGIWYVAWSNGYGYQAAAFRKMLTLWHEKIDLDAIHATNAEIAAKLTEDDVKGLNGLWREFLELSGKEVPGQPEKEKNEQPEKEKPAGGIAIIGGADGPTAVFVSTHLGSETPATTPAANAAIPAGSPAEKPAEP